MYRVEAFFFHSNFQIKITFKEMNSFWKIAKSILNQSFCVFKSNALLQSISGVQKHK